MTHDPERNAAAYLSGRLSRRRRRSLEAHILECEECWTEVDLGRRGRSFAEAARDLAPQALRERIRMSVEATPLPRPRWPRIALGAAALAISLITALSVFDIELEQPEQPEEIALLVADFESGSSLDTATPKRLPSRLGDLRLKGSRAGRVEGMDVTAHEYIDPAGHEVVVYQTDEAFPVAEGADHASSGETWTAEVEGAVLFCADHPVPSLVVGDDQKEVALAAAELGLH